MLVAIIGGRNRVVGAAEIESALGDNLASVSGVISGGARGADTSGAAWARARGIPVEEIRPDYQRYKRGAPLKRNVEIAARADLCLAFPAENSRGTWHCVNEFKKAGKPVIVQK